MERVSLTRAMAGTSMEDAASTVQGSRVSETCRSGAKIEFALLQLARVSFPRDALATVTLALAGCPVDYIVIVQRGPTLFCCSVISSRSA
jgi:hypothetical protein